MKFTTIYYWNEGRKQHLEIINGFETYEEAIESLENSINLKPEPGNPGIIGFKEQPGESLFIKYEDGTMGKIVGYIKIY